MRKLIFDKVEVDGNGYAEISGKLIIDVRVGGNGYNTISDINPDIIAAIGAGILKCITKNNNINITTFLDDHNHITNDMS